MKTATFLSLLLFTALLAEEENGKTAIDTLVAHIKAPRNIRTSPVKTNPFVGGTYTVKKSPPVKKPSDAPHLALQGIINKKAIIDGRLYGVGDTVNGYAIQTVTENGITLLKNGTLYVAKLSENRSEIQIKRNSLW